MSYEQIGTPREVDIVNKYDIVGKGYERTEGHNTHTTILVSIKTVITVQGKYSPRDVISNHSISDCNLRYCIRSDSRASS